MSYTYTATAETTGNPTIHQVMAMRYDYPTENEEEYASLIKKMNLADLQKHAITKSLKVLGNDRRRIENSLIREFNKFQNKKKALTLRTQKAVSVDEEKRIQNVEMMSQYFRKLG